MILEEFLKNGTLGSLHLGLSRNDVRGLLGEPPEYSGPGWKQEIWKYSNLELAFWKDALSFIGLSFDDGRAMLPEALIADGNMTLESDREEDVKEFLQANRIDFMAEEELTFDEYKILRTTASHVGLGFSKNRLCSIQLIVQKP